jgi:hypothetical protein
MLQCIGTFNYFDSHSQELDCLSGLSVHPIWYTVHVIAL